MNNKKVDELILLGEKVLDSEIQKSDLPYPQTVSGELCEQWKNECLIFADSSNLEESMVEKMVKLASLRVLTAKQARQLLTLLKSIVTQK